MTSTKGARRLYTLAEQLGYRFAGFDGSHGHAVFVHTETGNRLGIPTRVAETGRDFLGYRARLRQLARGPKPQPRR